MILIENKKAAFEYEIIQIFEAGIALLGTEVKSLKAHRGSLPGSRVIIRGGEAYLIGATIPAWQEKNAPPGFDPQRTRKLLLTKKEIKTLIGKEKTAGLTIIPLAIYTKGRLIKLRLALVRGKKSWDKREKIRERETKRKIERTLKRG